MLAQEMRVADEGAVDRHPVIEILQSEIAAGSGSAAEDTAVSRRPAPASSRRCSHRPIDDLFRLRVPVELLAFAVRLRGHDDGHRVRVAVAARWRSAACGFAGNRTSWACGRAVVADVGGRNLVVAGQRDVLLGPLDVRIVLVVPLLLDDLPALAAFAADVDQRAPSCP